jgi:uncharacterized membrane protein YfcA
VEGFLVLTAAASFVAGAIASVSGFGIGSLLTPLLNTQYDMRLAVAAVSIPHLVATSLRLGILRRDVDRRVLTSFGLMSAAGGLVGALLQRYATGRSLTLVFAVLLMFAGSAGLTGLSKGMRLGRTVGWIAGVVSGALGGLVGNQGGIRSAALLGYDLTPARFVATATAAGLIVDAARMPVYLAAEHGRLAREVQVIGTAIAGVVVGTLAGQPMLRKIPERLFRKLVGLLVLLLGLYMLSRA